MSRPRRLTPRATNLCASFTLFNSCACRQQVVELPGSSGISSQTLCESVPGWEAPRCSPSPLVQHSCEEKQTKLRCSIDTLHPFASRRNHFLTVSRRRRRRAGHAIRSLLGLSIDDAKSLALGDQISASVPCRWDNPEEARKWPKTRLGLLTSVCCILETTTIEKRLKREDMVKQINNYGFQQEIREARRQET